MFKAGDTVICTTPRTGLINKGRYIVSRVGYHNINHMKKQYIYINGGHSYWSEDFTLTKEKEGLYLIKI